MKPLRLITLAAALTSPAASFAYPEFQQYVQQNSGRNVNCSMCHSHPDGPDGVKAGQIGSLKPEALQRLNQARGAFDPGQQVDSPILNEFGNHIVEQMGRTQFIALRQHPEQLTPVLGTSDLDGDGVTDADEYVAGTHPLDPRHGPPMRLFVNNLRAQAFHIVMIFLATILGLFGLNNLTQAVGKSRSAVTKGSVRWLTEK